MFKNLGGSSPKELKAEVSVEDQEFGGLSWLFLPLMYTECKC